MNLYETETLALFVRYSKPTPYPLSLGFSLISPKPISQLSDSSGKLYSIAVSVFEVILVQLKFSFTNTESETSRLV